MADGEDIHSIVSMGYGAWGSVAGIVTLGYTPGAALSVAWSRAPTKG
jgi:hypothetical protein